MSGFLVINPRSGDDEPSAEELRAAAEKAGVETHLLEQDEDPAEVARAAGNGPLGMAGGDGSLAAIAEVALERGDPFVVVPFGTRNHFARDLGLDRDDPIAALQAFAGQERQIDVAAVNDRLFLNNVSLGLYARLVHRREEHRRRRDLFARLRAFGILLRHPRPLGLTIDGDPIAARVLFVGNNQYKLEVFELGERERLDEGLLHLYAAEGLLPTSWEERTGERFEVGARRGKISAAIDGEPELLDQPLQFEIRPRALRVLVPPRL
jgi:diacylglycerol kinase family enzyme